MYSYQNKKKIQSVIKLLTYIYRKNVLPHMHVVCSEDNTQLCFNPPSCFHAEIFGSWYSVGRGTGLWAVPYLGVGKEIISPQSPHGCGAQSASC
jgi:hypothetical protein